MFLSPFQGWLVSRHFRALSALLVMIFRRDLSYASFLVLFKIRARCLRPWDPDAIISS